MKKTALLLAILFCFAALAACGEGSTPPPDTEYPLSVLKVGVKSDVPNFGLQDPNTSEYTGFEIELAKLLAKELTGDETKIELTAVTAKTRGPLLDSGDVDMVIATFTITDERKLTYDFSTPYYEDAVGLLVKKDNGIASIADLAGKKVGVAKSSTSKESVEEAAGEAGITLAADTFLEFDSYPELKAALTRGNIDVFCVDRSILSGYLDDQTELLPDRFSPQNYGVATKLDSELSEQVNTLIEKWLGDGTINNLAAEWGI